jgi:hypothetical protein
MPITTVPPFDASALATEVLTHFSIRWLVYCLLPRLRRFPILALLALALTLAPILSLTALSLTLTFILTLALTFTLTLTSILALSLRPDRPRLLLLLLLLSSHFLTVVSEKGQEERNLI